MRLAAAASAAKADHGGAVRKIAQASGGAGFELAGLKEQARMDKVFHLVGQAAGFEGFGNELFGSHIKNVEG